ncbi:hypothetical protein THAOC_16861 [Thalassiosira oceanica]|uniref:Amine oxidase domain-containing protein n=1 Tax=Thalassiosira oceanica TaxID=159749 RepID=K0SC51_THAOC|nr:hypothetical protein THAOC_16861 [Thalassiosira oceanica]|eukprot:EJK62524.1 hypothetical protein THAOC_16861 [Thalassiosira oceanica]
MMIYQEFLFLLALAVPPLSDGFTTTSLRTTAGRRTSVTRSAVAAAPPPAEEQRRPTPPRIYETDNFREARELSEKFESDRRSGAGAKRVAIFGGGLSGLACAKYLSDAGHEPTVYEARDVLGGKVSAWRDDDGDVVETGLHIFFGAYPNMHCLFRELGIEDRLQWAPHRMTFAMQELPGEFTTFDFPPGVPAPFNMAAAILTNTKMLTLEEKIKMVPGLLPMLLEGQSFIDAQDELSVAQFMQKFGMPERINEEIFIAMGKALDFIDPDRLSMTVILTAMNRFINEADGSQTAFLDGNPPERLCEPIKQSVESKGGQVVCSSPVSELVLNEDNSVKHLLLANGTAVEADYYISAVPVDVFKRLVPAQWSTMPYFRQLDELRGIPVINIQLLVRSEARHDRRPVLLEVPAAVCLRRHEQELCRIQRRREVDAGTRLRPVLPRGRQSGELDRQDGRRDSRRDDGGARAALPRRGRARRAGVEEGEAREVDGRPGAPVGLRRDARAGEVPAEPGESRAELRHGRRLRDPEVSWFDGGGVLSGKLAAEVVCDKVAGRENRNGLRPAHSSVGAELEERRPSGVAGSGPIAFGGGQQGNFANP